MRTRFSLPLATLLVLLGTASVGCGGRREMAETMARQWRGAELYMRMCSVCHGASGQGYAADQAPALAGREFLATVTDAYLRNAIAGGRGGTTMSAWGRDQGGPLSPVDVDAVIAFIRLWGRRVSLVFDERPVTGDAARGAEAYDRECVKCHGASGVGGPNVHIGSTELLQDASNGYLRYAIRRGRPRTPMPSFEAVLGEAGAEDIVALLRRWQMAAEPPRHGNPARTPPLPLGPVPLNPRGADPVGFRVQPASTPVDAVKAQLDRGARMALLDARAPSDYANEHISGAVSVPFYDPSPYLPSLPKDVWYVCYCACPHAESGQLAQKLAAAGFKKVTVLDEGLGVWRARGYGTHGGISP